jgi:hypothetical protein
MPALGTAPVPTVAADPGRGAGRTEQPPDHPRGRNLVPLLVVGGALLTLAVGLVAKLAGVYWGAPLQPLAIHLNAELSTWAIPGLALLAATLFGGVRLLRSDLPPAWIGAALFAFTLLSRVALNVFRGGPEALSSVFAIGPHGEGRHEYLAGLVYLRGGVGNFLDDFDRIVPGAPTHIAGHPPGFVLTLHALGLETPAGAAALAIVVGALATPALYLLARQLFDERTARIAALLFVFVPTSLLYGATSADALYATLAVAAAAFLLGRGRWTRLLGAALLAVASFFSYALLGAGAWAVFVQWRRQGLAAAVRLALLCAAAVVALYLALYLATGFDVLAAIRATNQRYHDGIASVRPYLFWFFGSPAAFLLMLGPVSWFAARSLAAREATALGLALVIAVSVIAGYTKAETERIWLFLVPFACLAAARALPARWVPRMLIALGIQAILIEILFFTTW